MNLMLASIFPYQLLPVDDAANLVGDDVYNYDLDQNGYFNTDEKQASSKLYSTLNDPVATGDLLATSQQESNVLESVSFFDGLFDALRKISIYISLIIPFSTVLFLLPGALGVVIGGLYMGITVYAIARFIRGT
jgi:hypothetical protein